MRGSFNALDRYKDHFLLLSRIVIGMMFIFVHGMPKLMGGSERLSAVGSALSVFGIQFWPEGFGLIAALSEFVGGILLLIGFWFRPAAFFIFLTLFVASASHFANGGLFSAAHPIEVAILMLVYMVVGPGRFSIDRK